MYDVADFTRALVKMVYDAVSAMGMTMVVGGIPCYFEEHFGFSGARRMCPTQVSPTENKTSVLYYLAKSSPPQTTVEAVQRSLVCDDDTAREVLVQATSMSIKRLVQLQDAPYQLTRHGMAGAALTRHRCIIETVVFDVGNSNYIMPVVQILDISLVHGSVLTALAKSPDIVAAVERQAGVIARRKGWGYRVMDHGSTYLKDAVDTLARLVSESVVAMYDERTPRTNEISSQIRLYATRRYEIV